jgi:acyl carrier protein
MQQLRQLIARALNVPATSVQDTSSMESTEAWDSLAHMDVILLIEQHYNINLEGDEIADMQSVQAIAAILKAKGVAIE